MPTRSMMATAASARDARRVVEALSLHGIDGGRIHVRDPAVPRSARTRAQQRAVDASVMRRIGSRLAVGIAIGAVVGAAVGAAVLGLVTSAPVAALVGAGAGVVAGGGLGAAVGLQSTPSMAMAWEDANAPGPGARRIVVTDVDAREETELRAILARHARDVTVVGPG